MDGEAPELVQLCSSPTHPPDCDRNEQLSYIHHRLDRTFLEAATDPKHRLHKASLGPKSDLKVSQKTKKKWGKVYQKKDTNTEKKCIKLLLILDGSYDLIFYMGMFRFVHEYFIISSV